MAMTVGKKIMLISAASVTLSTAVALIVQSITVRSQGIEMTRNTMRAAIIAAESMRTSISAMRARHANFRSRAYLTRAVEERCVASIAESCDDMRQCQAIGNPTQQQ